MNAQPVSKPLIMPDRYDGSTHWSDYRAHFESCADINGWNDYHKSRFLRAVLTGNAQQVLTDFHGEEPSYRELSTALEARFGPGERAEVNLAELRNRQRKSNETLQELAQSIKRLTNLAYPEVDRLARDRLARIHFADAIADKDIKIHIFQARPTILEDAVRVALEAESFYEDEKCTEGSCSSEQECATNRK